MFSKLIRRKRNVTGFLKVFFVKYWSYIDSVANRSLNGMTPSSPESDALLNSYDLIGKVPTFNWLLPNKVFTSVSRFWSRLLAILSFSITLWRRCALLSRCQVTSRRTACGSWASPSKRKCLRIIKCPTTSQTSRPTANYPIFSNRKHRSIYFRDLPMIHFFSLFMRSF